MYAKSILICALIAFQFSRLSLSKSTVALHGEGLSDQEKQLLNFTQNVINSTLKNLLSFFNHSIAQTFDTRSIETMENTYKANELVAANCKNNWCHDWLQYYKNQINTVIDAYNKILRGVISGCLHNKKWIDCKLFVDYKTNIKKVIAIPKPLDEKITTWQNAEAICEKYGAKLISIESFAMQQFIQSYTQLSKTQLWTSAQKKNGKFYWITGNEISYTNWASGQPDNHLGAENCINLNQVSFTTWTWNDKNCALNCMVLCELSI